MPLIKIADIDLERSIQVRAKIDTRTVNEYTEHMAAKKPPLPPIVLFGPDSRGKYYLSEGWHRLEAHKKAGRASIQATIREGGWKDALEHALGSNAQHGLRRSNADKRHAVKLALIHWVEWSNNLVSNKCNVDEGTVRNVRSDMESTSEIPKLNTRIGADGKTRSVPPKDPPVATQADHSEGDASSGHNPEDEVPRSPTAGEPVFQTVQGVDEPPPLPLDRLNQKVPPHLVPLWERRREVQELLDELSRIHKVIQQAEYDRDPLYFGAGQGNTPVNFTSALGHLKQARVSIKEAMPFAVCAMCQGAGCRSCSGNGLISKFRYDTIIPAAKKVKA
jgi:uncharacterized ParB-like nuclease family protein